MALIKHNHAVDVARSAVVLDLGDLQRQGALILQSARDQAAAIIADARAERTRIMAGAAEAGHAAGLKDGLAAGLTAGQTEGRAEAIAESRARLQQLEASWGAALGAFEEGRASMLRCAETDLIRLAMLIAERVTKRQIETDPAVVVDQLRAVLATITRPTALFVRVHPDDVPVLEQAMPGLVARVAGARHVEFIHDASLERGSCIAEMRGNAQGAVGDPAGVVGGEIDASVTTQLQRIAEVLLPGDAAMQDGVSDDRD